MDPANSYYGHKSVLARYCRVPSSPLPRIFGYMQHGWNPYHGFGFDSDIYPDAPKFVWSRRVLAEVEAKGWRKCFAIGSPWAYLMKELGFERLPESRSGVLLYPFHGWEGGRVTGDHQALIDQVKAVELEPVTVCLYWLEYETPEIRSVYEASGFRVICHGHRDGGAAWPDSEGFLCRQYEELVRHRRVISNRLTTATMYAASLGCEVAVYGDPMELNDPGLALKQRSVNFSSKKYPEFFGLKTNVEKTTEIARSELGFDIILPRDELKKALGWCGLEKEEARGGSSLNSLAPVMRGKAEYLFSIILTTYNRPGLLKDALESIARQTLRNFQVILVNDHGDPVESLLAKYDFPITYIYQGKNQGLSAARNAGLKLAAGSYITYLDDDDIYLPNHLAVLAEVFEQNPEVVAYTAVEYVTERLDGEQRIELSRSMPFKHSAYSRERLFVQNYIPVNTWAHPRSMLEAVGGFDTSLTAFEDWDMLMRLAARYPFLHVPQITAEVHQRTSGGTDHMLGREQKNFASLYREMYRRHYDFGSEVVRAGRREVLKQFGVQEDSVSKEFVPQNWLQARSLSSPQRSRLIESLKQQGGGPSFGIVLLDLNGEPDNLKASLDSLSEPHQAYTQVQPIVLTTQTVAAVEGAQVVQVAAEGWLAQLNGVLSNAAFDWFLVAKAGDEFTANGLLVSAVDLAGAPGCRAVYADEMARQEGGEPGALLRPDLNLDLLLSLPASMAHHWIFRRDLWLEMGAFDEQYEHAFELDYILRLIERGGFDGLGHISEPLLITDVPTLEDNPQEREVITRHLVARGYPQPVVASRLPGRYEIDYGHPLQPKVSILIVVKDRLAWVQRCMDSLLEKTAYPNFEVLLLDHGNAKAEVLHWLSGVEQMGVAGLRVLRFDAESTREQIQNQAALQASGEYLLWLGDGAGILSNDWLKQLLNHAMRPEVGAVGGKLISGDGLIRHAGGVLGLGGPVGRAFLGHKADDGGYLQRLQVDQNYSALSGLCLMVRRELFVELGGFAEEPALSRWADADLCLRLQQAGYLNVWTPRAQLLMDEPPLSNAGAEEEDAMYERWLPVLARDPAYNPNFTLGDQQGFKLAPAQFTWKPLEALGVPLVMAHNADATGCGQYRIIQPHRALKEAGLIDGQVASSYMTVTELERYNPDAIILQRQIGETHYELMRRMKKFSRAFKVFELDDYIPNLPVKSVHRATMPKDIVKSLRRALTCVDRFVVSTEPLAEAFANMHGDIHVVKNTLDPRWWKGLVSERRISDKPRVGWAGGISHTGDLEMIADVVKALADEVEWVFFGMCPAKLRPYVHEYYPGVAIEQYPAALARLNLDLAIAPVEQNPFNECKSNLRLLEYGACGFPVVCSDLTCYQGDLPVTRVRNRFKDWVDAIRMHLADLDATAKQGDALRAAVHESWMLEGANLEQWRKAWLP